MDDNFAATLSIDLDAIAANWRLLAQRAAPARCAAVVKANGYGLGAVAVGQRLWREGARSFFVAHLNEGLELRTALPEAEIAVLNGLGAGGLEAHIEARLAAVLNRKEDALVWAAAAADRNVKLPAFVHTDSGMNRLGMGAPDVAELAGDTRWRNAVDVRAIMSHLVVSEEPDNPINAQQLGKFRAPRQSFADCPASLANSSAIFLGPDWHFDLVRPGAALYGINPTPNKPNPMRACVYLQAKILQVRRVDTLESVGYGAEWSAKRPSRIATVAVGYADGYLRSLGNRGWVAIEGQRVPIVGRISMDLITVDVSDLSASAARAGAAVELIGPTIGVDELAQWAGTNGYEMFTGLGRRYGRVYRGAGA